MPNLGYYLANSRIGFEEDDCHEFKAQRAMCIEELGDRYYQDNSNQSRRSRQPVSKTLNAFLNTGRGGTIFLGVMNNGLIKGINMTTYQRDHVKIALDDLLSRYNPKIPDDRIKLSFKPVLSREGEQLPSDGEDGCSVEVRFKRPHVLRSPDYCWCDKDAVAKYNMGIVVPSFVIEITVLPWDGKSTVPTGLPIYPIYQNEEGLCFFRRAASNKYLTAQEICDMTENQIYNLYSLEMDKLEAELDAKRKQLEAIAEEVMGKMKI